MYRLFIFGLITTVLTLLLGVSQPVLAQTNLGGILVYPNNMELDFTSGKKFISRAIMVENTNNTPTRIRAYVEGWNMKEDGNIYFLEKPAEDSLNKYIKFNPREFDLQPGQKQLVRVTAKVPEGQNGEYRSVIFFETVKSREDLVQKHKGLSLTVKFSTRFGVILWAYKGEIQRNSAIKNFIQDNNLYVTLENSGNAHTDISGELTLISKDTDKKEYKFPITKFAVLPNRLRQKPLDFDRKKLPEGDYTAKLYLSYKDITDNKQILEAETNYTHLATEDFLKTNLQVPVEEKIERMPDTTAKPEQIDETEIKLNIDKN